jgi:predicted transcriptional regulator YheO
MVAARPIAEYHSKSGDLVSAAPVGRGRGGFRSEELPAAFELLSRIGRAVATTVGPDCEVVVHDLRHPQHSVIAISGNLTGRHVGAPVPDPQLLPGEVDKFTDDDLRRTATTMAGRELLASTAWVRDTSGHIVGAMCINIDRSGLRRARDLIDAHLGASEPVGRPLTSFALDVAEFTAAAVTAVIGRVPRRRLRRTERVELLRRLDADGVFALRGAADAIAAQLAVSRSSIYGDLRTARWGRASSIDEAVVAVRHRAIDPPSKRSPDKWRAAKET